MMLWISEISEASFEFILISLTAAEGLNEIITQFLLFISRNWYSKILSIHVEYWVIVLIILSEKRVQDIMDMRSSWFLNIKSSQTEEHCSECSSGFEKVIVSMFMELIGGLQVILNSDYTHTRHSMCKVYLGWVTQSPTIFILIQS